MSEPMFFLDSCSMMEPFNTFYAFDICTHFWDSLGKYIESGEIAIIDKVYNEVIKREDALGKWLSELTIKNFIKVSGTQTQLNYSDIQDYIAAFPRFKPNEKKMWADSDCADPFLIAACMQYENAIIITQEKFIDMNQNDPKSLYKIKIPNVAQAFNIQTEDLFYMMRQLNIKA